MRQEAALRTDSERASEQATEAHLQGFKVLIDSAATLKRMQDRYQRWEARSQVRGPLSW